MRYEKLSIINKTNRYESYFEESWILRLDYHQRKYRVTKLSS